MKRIAALLVVLFGLAGGLWWWQGAGQEAPGRTPYRTVTADTGDILAQVSSTGTVSPITTVIVGSQLSGQIIEILADFNSEVKTGQVLARLNADHIRARLDAARAEQAQARASRSVLDAQLEKSRADEARADATAADMRAQLDRAQTQLADAEKTFARQSDLAQQGIVSATAVQASRTLRDTLISQRQSAQAQIASVEAQKLGLAADRKMLMAQMASADAQMLQRAALVRQIEVDLGNTDIRSPVDGVVVQRNVELGQPVAASLQAPTLFLVAEDLRKIQIQANVDESDVGRVRSGQPVNFTVNAYPGRTFAGTVRMVRLGSQTVQNVVIYTAIIDVDNPDLDLRPGMTANLRVVIERRQNVVRVPNAALRWRPPAGEEVTSAANPATAVGAARAMVPAADTSGGPFVQSGGRGGRGLFVERLKGELGLTDEQKAAVDRLLSERPDTGATGGAGGGRAAREAFGQRLRAILNDEQRAKLATMQAAGEGRRDQQGNAGTRVREGVGGRVYRLNERNEVQTVPVRLGNSDGAFTEIIAGVAAGDRLVTGGGAREARGPAFRFGF